MSLNGPIISVEDDEDDQYLLRDVVKNLGISNDIRFFANGKLALEYLETTSEKPFLILCDVNMPLMDGIEFRRRIISNEFLRRKSIPFIYLSTAASYEVVCEAYDATVQGFYQKSTNYAHFERQIGLIVDYWKLCLHPNSQF